MQIREIKLKDGRYLIFYAFEDEARTPSERPDQQPPKQSINDAPMGQEK
jgi:hypothetical protein